MSQNNPITISSWSLGDQSSLKEKSNAAKSEMKPIDCVFLVKPSLRPDLIVVDTIP